MTNADSNAQGKALRRERNVAKWLRAPFQVRQYRAAMASTSVCANPVDFLRRYATTAGDYPASIRLRTPIGPISLDVYSWHDTRTIHEIFLAGDYVTDKSAKVIVDYGSNIGISAAYFLSRRKDSFAYLFEPVPLNAERLTKNLKGFEGQYRLEKVAVAPNDGMVRFGVEDTGRYGGINLETGKYLDVQARDSNAILSGVIKEHGVIDILKIDVETMEYALVGNLTDQIASKIKLLFVEARFPTNPLSKTHVVSLQGTVTQLRRRA
jgi:FkbM family methyltransferase